MDKALLNLKEFCEYRENQRPGNTVITGQHIHSKNR